MNRSPFHPTDNCGLPFIILQKEKSLFIPISLLILLANPWLFSNPSFWYRWLSSSSLLTPPPRGPPASSIACFVFHFNEQLDSFISPQVLDLPYHPGPFEACQLVLSMDVSSLMIPLFFIQKEKEPLRQQASPEWEIRNLNITYLPAQLPTGFCKTQLNSSPLNFTLQYIKQGFLKHDGSSQAKLLGETLLKRPCLWSFQPLVDVKSYTKAKIYKIFLFPFSQEP